MPFVGLFVLLNVIVGCYVAIRLGYGPPNWQTALNLVVSLTSFQDGLNAWRDWIDRKAPWADKLLTRLHVPKPIMIVDTSIHDEEINETKNSTDNPEDTLPGENSEEQQSETLAEVEPTLSDQKE